MKSKLTGSFIESTNSTIKKEKARTCRHDIRILGFSGIRGTGSGWAMGDDFFWSRFPKGPEKCIMIAE